MEVLIGVADRNTEIVVVPQWLEGRDGVAGRNTEVVVVVPQWLEGRDGVAGRNTEVVVVVPQWLEGRDGVAGVEPRPGGDWPAYRDRPWGHQGSDRASQGVPAQARGKAARPRRGQPTRAAHQGPVSSLGRTGHPRHVGPTQDTVELCVQQVCGQVGQRGSGQSRCSDQSWTVCGDLLLVNWPCNVHKDDRKQAHICLIF